MATQSLALALAAFEAQEIKVIKTAKTNKDFYHVYYKKDGATRVMLVPRRADNLEQLQSEVNLLINRSNEDQLANGYKDAR